MKLLYPLFLLFVLTGCCRVAEMPQWPAAATENDISALYRFRLEHAGTTKFSGLLILKAQADGISSILLDASGLPLIRQEVYPDGSRRVESCAAPLRETRFPELLGKLVEYIYFTPGRNSCPWYAFTCVCQENGKDRQLKWKRFGPLHLWEVEQSITEQMKEINTVRMNLSSITAYLQEIDNGLER